MVTSSAVILPQMYKKVLDAERRSLGNRFGAKAAFRSGILNRAERTIFVAGFSSCPALKLIRAIPHAG
jgi:hypothetical protein